MKHLRNIILSVFGIIVFWAVFKIIPAGSTDTVYSPESFRATIKDKVNGIVTEEFHSRVYGVMIDSTAIYNFTYLPDSIATNLVHTYPSNFLQLGDSVYKEANSREYYVVRNDTIRKYILPKVKI